ncbi:MAG: hypothetical protein KKB03_03080 [Nanoarchaeota archaeon]|nr:hypothetical protein [Nanoarchaeota archaeon]MBU1135385.1 hypothetical protein [Nanoarchaeota archaeon]MBU2520198.1 hypothetical protein [Nanoarchaeota archaeon]
MSFEKTVMDNEIHDKYRIDPLTLLGRAMTIRPENQATVFDITTKMGGVSNLYYSLVFWLGKQDYVLKKVDEYMEVTPTHIDAYNLTIAQKQKLEGAIKLGLSSAAQAVADFELLDHDKRRYQEIWDYFKKGKKDDHVLRSLFIDRVDAYTGEGFSMVTMTKRWPTIITDFIRMGNKELENVDDIKRELDVSQAEATVLKSKNELFSEWKRLFLPTVKNRLARIENMVNAREKSVEEYKNWLKPYIARYRMMRESTEANPSVYTNDWVMTPGFSQAVAFSGIRLWFWKPFILTEKGRPTYEIYGKPKRGKWIFDPYDDLVKSITPKIEEKYGLQEGEIEDNIKKIIGEALQSDSKFEQYEFGGRPTMDPKYLYYQFFDISIMRSIIKTAPPEGGELENIVFSPLENWLFSQNVMLLHIIELWARERHFTNYVEQIVGSKNLENKIRDRLDAEYEGKKEKKKNKKESKFASSLSKSVKNLTGLFVKPGPYETNFKERITKLYLVDSGANYGPIIKYIKANIGA